MSEFDLARAMDNVWGCWPEHELLAYRTPEDEGFMQLERNRILLGGAPGPDGIFTAEREREVKGLRVEWKRMGVKVHLRARVWSIGTKGELPA